MQIVIEDTCEGLPEKARQLAMIVNGAGKAQTVKRLMESPVDTAFPSRILKLHPNFTLILDKDAAAR
jgi:6-phosphogluconolactonase/glucosamine-6-phosphate isomerase/deaminase